MRQSVRKRVLIRVDFFETIGFGHISRCVALANAMAEDGYKVLICTTNKPGLVAPDFYYHTAIKFFYFNDIMKFQQIYLEFNPSILIIDLLETFIDASEKQQIIRMVDEVDVSLCFDDFFSNEVNYTYHVGPDLLKKESKLNRICGLEYLLFRNEFITSRRNMQFVRNESSLLISLGSIDPSDATYRVIDALIEYDFFDEINVIIGKFFSKNNVSRIHDFVGENKSFKIHNGISDVSKFYIRSNICIVSGGQSKFEANLLGSFPILLAHNECEANACKICNKEGLGLYLGLSRDFKAEKLICALNKFRKSPERLEKIRVSINDKIDGLGAKRIAKLLGETVSEI